jgi:hypothetical protein
MREYKYMTLSSIKKLEPDMRKLKVSEVARSPRGFLTAYKQAQCNPDNLSEAWKIKRHGFIRRHKAQLKSGERRRTLALQAWAYNP